MRRALLLAVVVLVAYHDALGARFVLDDYHYVLENAALSLAHVPALFAHRYDSGGATFYRPLSTASFALDRALFGVWAAGFHAVNLVWHWLASLALLALLRRLFSPMAALWGALIFAVHPVHTEAVTGIVGRTELMAAAFSFAGAALWLDRRRSLALVCALFALWSKESGLLCVPLALACELYRDRAVHRAWLFALPLAAYGTLRVLALRDALLPVPEPLFSLIDAASARATAVAVIGRDLSLLVWPHPLVADYGYAAIDPSPSLFSAAPLLALAVIAAIIGASIALHRLAPYVALASFVTLVALAPVSNLFLRINVVMAERLLYAPSVGVAILVAGVVTSMEATAALRVLRLALGALVVTFGILCMQRNLDWETPLSLWKDTVEKQPRSGLAHANLALACETVGDRACALSELRRAVAIEPFRADFAHTLQQIEAAPPPQ